MSVKTVKLSDITKGREIASGGEGKIFEHPSDKNKVIKVYHKARNSGFIKHLEKISSLPDMFFIVPVNIYIDSKSKVLGYDMKYVDFNKYYLFNNLFNKGFCSSNGITAEMKIELLDKIKIWLKEVHNRKIVIGDLNQYNLFFALDGTFLFVDVDSYQTQDNPHSGEILEDIRDYTTTDINENTDNYAYDVLSFWSLTYCHPYMWMVPGNKESLEQRVRSFKSILSKIPGIKIPALYEPVTGEILKQFNDIFNSGRRYLVEFNKNHVSAPVIIKQKSIESDKLNIRELYTNVINIFSSENFISISTKKGEWKLINTFIKGLTREVSVIKCDELYPSDNKCFAYRIDNSLYSGDGKLVKNFQQPTFYYNNTFLCIIDYATDFQWNYNLNNQLSGIDNTNTIVFAKSIIKRSSLIQNFGSQKYLDIPFGNRYRMVKISNNTKDAIYNNGYVATELKNQNRVEFQIVKDDKSTDFEYLPFFAVNKTGIIVPEDGFIDIYSDNLQFIVRFECPVCSRNSRLFYTQSGILLLEDKTLYLLNTK